MPRKQSRTQVLPRPQLRWRSLQQRAQSPRPGHLLATASADRRLHCPSPYAS